MSRVLRLALRNVGRNRRRTALALLAMASGVSALVALRGFVNGQQDLFRDGVILGQVGALQVHRAGYLDRQDSLPLHLDLVDDAAMRARLAVPGVRAVAPRLVFGALLSPPEDAEHPGRSSFLTLTALDPPAERAVAPLRWDWVEAGALPTRADGVDLVLSQDLSTSLHLVPLPPEELPPEEQRLALLATDRDGTPAGELLVLRGTLLGAIPGDRRLGFLGLTTAQRLLRMDGRVTEYALAVDDLAQLPDIQRALQERLGPGVEVHTWDEIMPFMKDVVHNMDLMFAVSMALLMVVVLLGITNAMLMNVLERVREIGTLLAVGMRRRQVVRLLVLEGVLLGLLGGLLGVVAGALLVALLRRTGIPMPVPGSALAAVVRPHVETGFLGFAWGLSVAVAALAAAFPAWRASRLRPAEALHHA